MIGNIYITGVIGSTDEEKGVELIDVVSQVEPLKECTQINCFINSPGGSVEVGKSIAQYLKSLPNVVTIATGQCASIATEIHLSVPLANRKIVEGTEYMIHNPLFANIDKANTNDLKEMVSILEPIEKDMVKMYVEATGVSKDAISALMDVEAFLTTEQLLSLNFVSEVIPKIKPLAFLTNNNKMSKPTIKLGLVAKAMAKLQGRTVEAIIETVEQGSIETPFSDLMVGDPIMLDGVEAPADTYVLPNGTKLVVVEAGIISEIILADDTSVEYTDQINALNSEIEAKNAEIEALKAELQTSKEAMAIMETEHAEVVALVDSLKEKKSTYTPPVASSNFRKTNAPIEKTQAQTLAERREMLNQKKK